MADLNVRAMDADPLIENEVLHPVVLQPLMGAGAPFLRRFRMMMRSRLAMTKPLFF